jgi:glycosyltransferase involved in cell wall biosynthesis
MQSPLVSAVVLCYNHAQFVRECLESVRLQNYPNLELVINDDASRDGSVGIIEDWLKDNPQIRHRFLRNKKNEGLCRSLNNALAQTSGKYFCGIAADDMWLPGKITNQTALMERLPGKVGVVYSDALRMDEHGAALPPTFLEATMRNSPLTGVPEGDIHLALWQANFVAPMTTLIRRECFDRVGVFDESKLAEDWDMWLRLSRHYDFIYSPMPSAKYRKVTTSICNAQLGRLLDDENHTCLKHLSAGNLDKAGRAAATDRMYNLAICSYERRTSRHTQNLLHALRFRATPGLLLRYAFALCGMRPDHFDRVRKLLRK